MNRICVGLFALIAVAGCTSAHSISDFRGTPLEPVAEAVVADEYPTRGRDALRGLDINARAEDGGTLLYLAFRENRLESMRGLLEDGADPWLGLDSTGEVNVPWLVVQRQDLAQLELLLDTGLEVDRELPGGDGTLLLEAAFVGWVEGVDMLLDHGADINAGGERRSAVENAIASGRYDLAVELLERGYARDLEDVAVWTSGRLVNEDMTPHRLKLIAVLRERGIEYPPKGRETADDRSARLRREAEENR